MRSAARHEVGAEDLGTSPERRKRIVAPMCVRGGNPSGGSGPLRFHGERAHCAWWSTLRPVCRVQRGRAHRALAIFGPPRMAARGPSAAEKTGRQRLRWEAAVVVSSGVASHRPPLVSRGFCLLHTGTGPRHPELPPPSAELASGLPTEFRDSVFGTAPP